MNQRRMIFLLFASMLLYATADDRTTRQIAIDIDTTLTTCCADIAENFIGTFTVIESILASQQGGCKTQIINQATIGTTGFTITTSGVYTVVEDIVFNPATSSAAITINADNVVLNLQCFSIVQGNSTANVDGISVSANVSSVSIENGKLANFARDGIRIASGCSLIAYTNITIQNCLYGIFFLGTDVATIADIEITGLDLISNSTGMSLNFVERAIVSTCNFFGNTHAGIELISSFSNTIEGCSLENTNAIAGSAFAISLIDGGNNRVNTCYIDGVSTADTFSGNSAVGILIGATENDDIIINNQISNCTTSSNAQPFGIEMLYTCTAVNLITTITNGHELVLSNWSPSGRYLASSAESAFLVIYEFKNNHLVQTFITPGQEGYTGWSADSSFIASGNQILRFDQGLAKTIINGDNIGSSAYWSPNGKYIAIGGVETITNPNAGIFSFNGSQLVPVVKQPNFGLYVSWSPDGNYLVSSSSSGVFVYKFVNNNSLQQIASIPGNTTTISCNWSNDGRFILLTDISNNIISVYQFTGTSIILIETLVFSSPQQVTYTQWSPDSRFVIASLQGIAGEFGLELYQFTGTALVLVSVTPIPVLSSNFSLNWSPLGNVISYSFEGFFPSVFSGQQFPSGSTIQNNKISNVRGPSLSAGQPGFSSGRGLSASSGTNLIIQNTAFDNDINYVFVNNVFEQFVSNAAQQPSIMANISFPPL